MREQRTRRHAMKHESEPSGDILEVGAKMAAAAAWFLFLVPIGFLISLCIVEILS